MIDVDSVLSIASINKHLTLLHTYERRRWPRASILIKKKLFRTEYKLRNADFVRHSDRTRARTRRRTRRCISAFDLDLFGSQLHQSQFFEYEDEHDDEDDLSDLRMANRGDRR